MKRWVLIVLLACSGLIARAQEDLLPRIVEANTFTSLQASFRQVRHSSLMTRDLESRGTVWLQSPDKVRWEVTAPFSKVTVYSGEIPSGRRFRLPTEKDFTAAVLEGDELSVTLDPVRRDLRDLFRRIVLTLDRKSLRIREVLLVEPDGDWTSIVFSDIRSGIPLDAKLFEKQ